MIESTVSRGAAVTSSSCPAMSTWQLGAKHSITKRSTHGPRREVCISCMARPRRVREPRMVLSCLVARGLTGHFAKGWPVARSWLKICGREGVNPSAPGRTSRAVPTAPMRPCGRPGPPAAGWRRLGRAGPGGVALGLAQQHPAGGGHGREAESRGCRPADGRPVHDQHDGDEHAAERRPADDVAGRLGRGVGGGGRGGGCGGRGGRSCVHGSSLKAPVDRGGVLGMPNEGRSLLVTDRRPDVPPGSRRRL